MAYPRETRTQARNLYVHSRLTVPAIAVNLGVPQGTISRWKTDAKLSGDDWDIARSATTMTGDGFEKLVSDAVEDFTVMFQTTMTQTQEATDIAAGDKVKLMASLADSFQKMVNAAGRASPKLSKLGVATEILHSLAEFIRKDFPSHQEAFLEILEPFGHELAKDLGQ